MSVEERLLKNPELAPFLAGKSDHTLLLFDHFVAAFEQVGAISLHPAKTMIGIANAHKRVAWITQLGKNFIHVVFPFKERFDDNLCFQKIAQVPGTSLQFNHHFRMLSIDDINEEMTRFLKCAYGESE